MSKPVSGKIEIFYPIGVGDQGGCGVCAGECLDPAITRIRVIIENIDAGKPRGSLRQLIDDGHNELLRTDPIRPQSIRLAAERLQSIAPELYRGHPRMDLRTIVAVERNDQNVIGDE